MKNPKEHSIHCFCSDDKIDSNQKSKMGKNDNPQDYAYQVSNICEDYWNWKMIHMSSHFSQNFFKTDNAF